MIIRDKNVNYFHAKQINKSKPYCFCFDDSTGSCNWPLQKMPKPQIDYYSLRDRFLMNGLLLSVQFNWTIPGGESKSWISKLENVFIIPSFHGELNI